MLAHAEDCELSVSNPTTPQLVFCNPSALPRTASGAFYGMVLPPPGVSPLAHLDEPPAALLGAPVTLEQAKQRHVETILSALAWNMGTAAKVLDIERRTLYRMCERWGLKRPDAL